LQVKEENLSGAQQVSDPRLVRLNKRKNKTSREMAKHAFVFSYRTYSLIKNVVLPVTPGTFYGYIPCSVSESVMLWITPVSNWIVYYWYLLVMNPDPDSAVVMKKRRQQKS
jgi:hypothetical protein